MLETDPQLKENPLSAFVTDIPSRRSPPAGTSKIFNMRCPSCRKLYQVQSLEIFSEYPHFKCLRCQEKFTFENPPLHPNSIQTFPLSAVNKTSFTKTKERPDNTPLIAKLWHELVSDYSNITKHFEFISRCEDLQALPYALKRYESMKKAQPHDEVTAGMLESVMQKTTQNRVYLATKNSLAGKMLLKSRFDLIWKNLGYMVALGLIVSGVGKHGHRNLIGFGVAILMITVGMKLLQPKGELRTKSKQSK